MKNKQKKSDELPAYLIDKTNLLLGVTISVLFALVFLVVYSPYSNTAWFGTGKSERFFLTAFFVVVSTMMLICSRVLMFFLSKKIIHLNYFKYIIWLVVEIIVIGAFHAIITWEYIHPDGYEFSFLLMKSILITLLALGVPFIITDLSFALFDARKLLLITDTSRVASDGEAIAQNMDLINITDNNGVLRLSVKLDNLYFIKSEDNYIKVYYTKKGVMSSYMLRCKIQTIEDTFIDSPLMRCHRMYIVNTQKVKVLRNESDGYYIDFDHEGCDSIPVSKTYSENIIKRFSRRS